MKCAWQAYLHILPQWMRQDVDKLGQESLQELRLRIDKPPELVHQCGVFQLKRRISREDLDYCVNAASQYSPWASTTVCNGYITAQGGHRIGVCGDVAVTDGRISTVKNITSLCIRVARDFPGVANGAKNLVGNTLIIGTPGSGKTTLLRDMIRMRSNDGTAAVAVVDERRELFPVVGNAFCFQTGLRTEVLAGCRKAEGIQMLLRTMNPGWIAVDEITAGEDCDALIQGAWCGVNLMATAHAKSIRDLFHRPVYKHLLALDVFENILVMQADKTWKLERINL